VSIAWSIQFAKWNQDFQQTLKDDPLTPGKYQQQAGSTPDLYPPLTQKVAIDLQYGDDTVVADSKRNVYADISAQIKAINQRVQNVRQEFKEQREREAAYRSTSETVNSVAVWYTVMQMIVLGSES
jgi:emp24/gp25L/p24 family/GOLD